MKPQKHIFDRAIVAASHKTTLTSSCPTVHFHDHYEIFLFLGGDASILCGNTRYKAKRGDIFLYNPNDVHMIYNNTDIPFERCCIHFDPQLLKPFCSPEENLLDIFNNPEAKSLHIPAEKLPIIIDYFDKVHYYTCNTDAYASKIMSVITLVSLIVELNTSFINEDYPQSDTDGTAISKIMQYIDEHLTEKFSLDDISRIFNIEKCYLCKLFKSKTGTSIMQFIISKRIALAKTLLDKGLSVHQTSVQCGFGNYAHFSRTFKNITGLTASKYRSRKSK